jgi:hypothetical protein
MVEHIKRVRKGLVETDKREFKKLDHFFAFFPNCESYWWLTPNMKGSSVVPEKLRFT